MGAGGRAARRRLRARMPAAAAAMPAALAATSGRTIAAARRRMTRRGMARRRMAWRRMSRRRMGRRRIRRRRRTRRHRRRRRARRRRCRHARARWRRGHRRRRRARRRRGRSRGLRRRRGRSDGLRGRRLLRRSLCPCFRLGLRGLGRGLLRRTLLGGDFQLLARRRRLFRFLGLLRFSFLRLLRHHRPPDRSAVAITRGRPDRLGAGRSCDRIGHHLRTIRPTVRPRFPASSKPPASDRLSPSRSARSDGQPGSRCPPRSG
jgi:hypothetical protein